MRVATEELTDRVQSGRAIYKSAEYFEDLGIHLDDTLHRFFNHVRKIPYKEDAGPEIVGRPKYLMGRAAFDGIDCKKKAVLIGAWANAHNVPWRLIAISERPDKKIHHVFPQLQIENQWKTVDATYPEYKMFMSKPSITAAEELPR